MAQVLHSLDLHFTLPAVRVVRRDRPLAWLAAGWQDIQANPLPSLAYGLLFSLAGDMLLLAFLGHPHLFVTAISGFMLVGPLLAAGLYELSRKTSEGESIAFIDSLAGFTRNGQSLALFGLVLALIALTWERTSAVLFALSGAGDAVNVQHLFSQVFTDGAYRSYVALWLILGGSLAILTFALSVVAVPLMQRRDLDCVTAMMLSLRAFAANLDTLILWAGLIAALTLFGFATLLVGLVVLMPLLGHASWHASRELVE